MSSSPDELNTSTTAESSALGVAPRLRQMTVAEKAAFTTGQDFWFLQSDPELGLPPVRLGDGPHGLRVQPDESDELGLNRSLPSTCFPPAVTLASSWDPDLVREVGAALGREARSLGVHVVLGPGMNIKRSPLCGRNFEYYSEDPFLTGSLAAAAVVGLQSQGVGACPKHFAANNQETDRYRISADIDERTLREIYLRGFQTVVEKSAPWMVMSSYNRINGEYTDQSHRLVSEILKQEWGFDGIVVSDWGAVYDPVGAVQAGVDLRMPGRPDDPRVREAAAAGEISEDRIDDFITRLIKLTQRVIHPPDRRRLRPQPCADPPCGSRGRGAAEERRRSPTARCRLAASYRCDRRVRPFASLPRRWQLRGCADSASHCARRAQQPNWPAHRHQLCARVRTGLCRAQPRSRRRRSSGSGTGRHVTGLLGSASLR